MSLISEPMKHVVSNHSNQAVSPELMIGALEKRHAIRKSFAFEAGYFLAAPGGW